MMTAATRIRVFFSAIIVLYIGLGLLFATRTPAWQAPDEPAHYNTIRQMAAGDLLPQIEMGDWNNAYLETLKAQRFAPDLLGDLDRVQYEDHQPPLYYWLATPVYWASDGRLIALRLYSLALGAITITLSFVIVRLLMPQRPALALATMALVAFTPQHLAILASVNNDALAGALIALTLWTVLRYLRGDAVTPWQLGVLIGLIAITKTTAYFMAGVVGVAIVLKWSARDKRTWRPLFHALLTMALPAALFAGAYWGRNIIVYGFPDFLGLQRHHDVVVGQLRTSDYIAEIGVGAYWQTAIQTTFNSFWGQFGWMGVPMNGAIPRIYQALVALVALALVGALIHAVLQMRLTTASENQQARFRWHSTLILALVVLLSLLQFIYYNLTFVQFQGRYLFTALIPIAFVLALGIDTWRDLLLRRWGWSPWLTVIACMGFAVLDFYLIWRVIPGALMP